MYFLGNDAWGGLIQDWRHCRWVRWKIGQIEYSTSLNLQGGWPQNTSKPCKHLQDGGRCCSMILIQPLYGSSTIISATHNDRCTCSKLVFNNRRIWTEMLTECLWDHELRESQPSYLQTPVVYPPNQHLCHHRQDYFHVGGPLDHHWSQWNSHPVMPAGFAGSHYQPLDRWGEWQTKRKIIMDILLSSRWTLLRLSSLVFESSAGPIFLFTFCNPTLELDVPLETPLEMVTVRLTPRTCFFLPMWR